MNSSNSSLFISDFGLVNALGGTRETITRNMFTGSREGIVKDERLLHDGPIYVGKVKSELPPFDDWKVKFQTRNNQLAMAALLQIQNEIEDLTTKFKSTRIGVIVGTSTSGIAEGEQAVSVLNEKSEFPKGYQYQQQEMSNLSEFIAEQVGISGPNWTISTACSSSAKAFITAKELIDANVIDAAIVGGVDTLCEMTINGFYALDSTAKTLSQPSSANRDGINIGEAAAIAVLRKDKGTIKLVGCGESSDAHHMSAPHPEGEGAISTMNQAITEANLKPSDIGYVNLHGTATPKNDEMEAKAVSSVFENPPPCSSVKGLVGHTLGAAGATEIGLCWLMLQDKEGRLIPHVWDNEPDLNMPQLPLVDVGDKRKVDYCLSNSFAFGGNNVTLVIGR